MSFKRKIVFLPSKYSEVIVDNINAYFDMGYEIGDILKSDDGYYILLILNDNENYGYKHVSKFVDNNTCDLIEEKAQAVKEKYPEKIQVLRKIIRKGVLSLKINELRSNLTD